MISENVLFYSFYFGVFPGEELREGQEAWLVLGLVVVAVLYLTLERCKLDGLVTSAWMSAVNNSISGLETTWPGDKKGEKVYINSTIASDLPIQ